MPVGLDVAGVVGTWIAAALALIALVAIVGPLLVWKATKSERHMALDALGMEASHNGGFVTKGIRVTSTIRLFRTVKAPVLTYDPFTYDLSFPGITLAWDSTAVLPGQSAAGWVKLGSMLKAYGVHYDQGDVVRVQNKETVLPVRKTWVFIIGICGRFGKRMDKGKLPVSRVGNFVSAQALPGTTVTKQEPRDTLPDGLHPPGNRPGWMTSDPKWQGRREYSLSRDSVVSDGTFDYEPLHGLMGTLHIRSDQRRERSNDNDIERVYFSFHGQTEIGAISKEPLPLRSLFWLSVGCLPYNDGRVYSLENFQTVVFQSDDDNSDDEHISPFGPFTPPMVHFDDERLRADSRPSFNYRE